MNTKIKQVFYGVLLGVLLIAPLFAPTGVGAQTAPPPGSLDTTFSFDGYLVEDEADTLQDLEVQPDGKILVASFLTTQGTGNIDIVLMRYNTDGSLDTSFSDDGQTILTFGALHEFPAEILLHSDGKITVVADIEMNGQEGVGVARFNPDGSLDTSFSDDGLAFAAFFTTSDAARNLAVGAAIWLAGSPGGSIIVAGYYDSAERLPSIVVLHNHAYVAKILPNGELDHSFAGDGISEIDEISEHGLPDNFDLAQTPTGFIMVGRGAAANTLNWEMHVFNLDGSYNQRLSNPVQPAACSRVTCLDRLDSAASVEVQPDGKALVIGTNTLTSGPTVEDEISAMYLLRFNPDWTPDASFGNDGALRLDAIDGENGFGFDLALQPDGKIVTLGSVVARLNPDGSPDRAFGSNGSSPLPSGDYTVNQWPAAAKVELAPDGKIIIGFSIEPCPEFGCHRRYILARYNGDTGGGGQDELVWLSPLPGSRPSRTIPISFYIVDENGARIQEQQPVYLGVYCPSTVGAPGPLVQRFDLGVGRRGLRFITGLGIYKAVFNARRVGISDDTTCSAIVHDLETGNRLGEALFNIDRARKGGRILIRER